MRAVRLLSLTFSCAFTMSFAAPAHGASITVVNGDFSTLPATGLNNIDSKGNFSANAGIPGWITASFAGQYAPAGNAAFTGANGSNVIAYSNGPSITQTVSATVVAGQLYTLSLDLGYRNDTAFTGGADLLIGGPGGTQYFATGLTPVRGTFGLFTSTYLGTAADAGKSISIELTSGGAGLQGDYDNVALNSTAAAAGTPEPSSFALLGTGMLGLAGAVRRKFRRS